MDSRLHPVLRIDLSAIVANWQLIDRLSAKSETCAVVKSNSYGLGAVSVSQALHQAGCRHFFTASLPEALQIVQSLPDHDGITIAALNGFSASDAAAYAKTPHLVPVLNSPEQVRSWQQMPALHSRAAWVQIDTGMSRLGLTMEEWRGLSENIGFPVRAVISHLVSADDPTCPLSAQQREQLFSIPNHAHCLANSAGCFLGQEYLGDYTRPGIALYGGNPFNAPTDLGLRPCVTLDAPILQIRHVKAGESIGYSATYCCEADCQIALVGIGYNDGLPRLLNTQPEGFCGWYDDHPLPIRGRISMDSLALEIPPNRKIPTNARITFLGQRQTIDDLAKACNTIPHEAFTRLGGRIVRHYLD